MAVLVLIVVLLATTVNSDAATWCICKPGLGDAVLQKTLDYACGTKADCTPILQNGVCYQPNTVIAHCSYAVNSYFQRAGQTQESCVFSNTTTVTQTDPSTVGSCVYPSSSSSAGTNSTTPPSSATPSTTPPTTFSPPTGGFGSGIGPTGFSSSDPNDGGLMLQKTKIFSGLLILWFSGLVFFCN